MKTLSSRIERVENELVEKLETLEKRLQEMQHLRAVASDRAYELKEEVMFLRGVISFLTTKQED